MLWNRWEARKCSRGWEAGIGFRERDQRNENGSGVCARRAV